MQGRIDVCALLGGSCLGTQGLATSTVAIQSVSIADCPLVFRTTSNPTQRSHTCGFVHDACCPPLSCPRLGSIPTEMVDSSEGERIEAGSVDVRESFDRWRGAVSGLELRNLRMCLPLNTSRCMGGDEGIVM